MMEANSKLKLNWVIGLISIIIGLTFIIWKWKSRSVDVFEKKAIIEKGEVAVKILSTGTIQPQNRLEIKPPVAGRIERIFVVEGQKVQKGKTLAIMSSTERAALIDEARAHGTEELSKWENLYKPTPILAPISGSIILRNVEPGQTFTINDAVLVMSDRLTVKAQVDETDLAQIHLKQEAEVFLDAYPDQKISAKVEQIAYEAKTVNNVTTYLIDILPESIPEFMRSGMTANVVFHGPTKKNILIIPNEFIKYDNGKPFALLQTSEGGKSERRDVKLGLSDGKISEVISGLNEGETVLLQLNKKEFNSGSPFSPMGNRRSGPSGQSGR